MQEECIRLTCLDLSMHENHPRAIGGWTLSLRSSVADISRSGVTKHNGNAGSRRAEPLCRNDTATQTNGGRSRLAPPHTPENTDHQKPGYE